MSNKNVTFKFVEKFIFVIIISLAIIVAGTCVTIFSGINFGIDFTGGTTIEIDLDEFAVDNQDVQSEVETIVTDLLNDKGYKSNGAMQFSTTDDGVTCEVRLSYYLNGEISKDQEEDFIKSIQGDTESGDIGLVGEIQQALETKYGDDFEDDSVKAHTVGATASSSLITSAIIALLVAIVVMLIYIVIRFTLSSALAAVCALFHDVLIMIALTAIFQVTVNSTFIAAVITIVGYSINATIIIFDRIREEMELTSSATKTYEEIANFAVTKTLSRTILTSLTTLIMVVLLAFLSVSTIKEFIIPIIFGLIAGTVSSTMIAPALWTKFKKIWDKIKSKKA